MFQDACYKRVVILQDFLKIVFSLLNVISLKH